MKGKKGIKATKPAEQKVYFALQNAGAKQPASRPEGYSQTATFVSEFLTQVVAEINNKRRLQLETPTIEKKGAKKQLFAVVWQEVFEGIGLSQNRIQELLRIGGYLK